MPTHTLWGSPATCIQPKRHPTSHGHRSLPPSPPPGVLRRVPGPFPRDGRCGATLCPAAVPPCPHLSALRRCRCAGPNVPAKASRLAPPAGGGLPIPTQMRRIALCLALPARAQHCAPPTHSGKKPASKFATPRLCLKLHDNLLSGWVVGCGWRRFPPPPPACLPARQPVSCQWVRGRQGLGAAVPSPRGKPARTVLLSGCPTSVSRRRPRLSLFYGGRPPFCILLLLS